jgi:hypothetical protein
VIKEDSILRAVLVFLSSGGLFFSAQCFDKSLRAFVAHGGGTRDAFVRAAQHQGEGVTAPAGNEMGALG